MKILIDMIKLSAAMIDNPDLCLPEAIFLPSPNTNGLKTIRELATFRFTCRKCEEAPCMAVCPAEALEKDEEGLITRHTNLCISCKSCVTICPFGTMMTDFFIHHRNKDLFYDLTMNMNWQNSLMHARREPPFLLMRKNLRRKIFTGLMKKYLLGNIYISLKKNKLSWQ